MKIYIEMIYILNFLLDFMILYGTKRLLKINKSIIRIIISSIFGSLTTILLELHLTTIELLFIKIIFSFLMIMIAFGIKNIIKNLLYFYAISTIIGGLIYLFDLNINFYMNFILLMIIFPIIIYLIIKESINYKVNINNKYLVTIKYNNKTYKLEGFIDTGNKLKSPISNKSVILVNLKIKFNNVIYIPYKALNTEGIIPCIKPDKVLINNKEYNNYLVGLAKEKFSLKDYNCILPNKLKEDLI